MTVGPIWNTGGTETEIIVPVSVLGPERAGTEMGGDQYRDLRSLSKWGVTYFKYLWYAINPVKLDVFRCYLVHIPSNDPYYLL